MQHISAELIVCRSARASKERPKVSLEVLDSLTVILSGMVQFHSLLSKQPAVSSPPHHRTPRHVRKRVACSDPVTAGLAYSRGRETYPYLEGVRICHPSPGVLQDVAVKCHAVVHAANGIRHPAISSGIHEPAWDTCARDQAFLPRISLLPLLDLPDRKAKHSELSDALVWWCDALYF